MRAKYTPRTNLAVYARGYFALPGAESCSDSEQLPNGTVFSLKIKQIPSVLLVLRILYEISAMITD